MPMTDEQIALEMLNAYVKATGQAPYTLAQMHEEGLMGPMLAEVKRASELFAPPAADELVACRSDISLRCQVAEALAACASGYFEGHVPPVLGALASDAEIALCALLARERALLDAQKAGGEVSPDTEATNLSRAENSGYCDALADVCAWMRKRAAQLSGDGQNVAALHYSEAAMSIEKGQAHGAKGKG